MFSAEKRGEKEGEGEKRQGGVRVVDWGGFIQTTTTKKQRNNSHSLFFFLHCYHCSGRPIRVEVGKFKGKFRLFEKGATGVPPPVDLLKMYQPVQYVARVYCLEAYQLVPKDRDGK